MNNVQRSRSPSPAPAQAPTERAPAEDAGRPSASPISRLSPENIRAIGAHLRPRDVGVLSAASRPLRDDLRPQLRAQQITQVEAPAVGTLVQFRAVLGNAPGATADPRSISELPGDVRSQPLASLGGRIMALAPQERGRAVREFLALDQGGVAHPMLDGLTQAAQGGWAALAQRETLLASPGGAAYDAVNAGGNVQAVARNLAISGQRAIETLEDLTMRAARGAVQQGEPAPVVARRLGITTAQRLQTLNDHALDHHALPAVSRGEHPAAVAARMEITNPQHRDRLHLRAANIAVGQGQNVELAANTFGIQNPEAIRSLELVALRDFGPDAVRDFPDVRQAAQHLGIRSEMGIRTLEHLAVDSHGLSALQRGEPLAAVTARLGLQMPSAIDRLAEYAAELAPPAKRPRQH